MLCNFRGGRGSSSCGVFGAPRHSCMVFEAIGNMLRGSLSTSGCWTDRGLPFCLGPPVVPLLPPFWGRVPGYSKKGTQILSFLLEDLAVVFLRVPALLGWFRSKTKMKPEDFLVGPLKNGHSHMFQQAPCLLFRFSATPWHCHADHLFGFSRWKRAALGPQNLNLKSPEQLPSSKLIALTPKQTF